MEQAGSGAKATPPRLAAQWTGLGGLLQGQGPLAGRAGQEQLG